MILVTGGAGFIGSAFIKRLNEDNITDIMIVDRLGDGEKWKNLRNLKFTEYIEVDEFEELLKTTVSHTYENDIQHIVHLGACSNTTVYDATYMMNNNYRFSKWLYLWAQRRRCPFLYASSAATYGLTENLCSVDLPTLNELRPLNIYGYSKQLFDISMVKEIENGNPVTGLKFFNVYGPNEYHKGKMASMICQMFEKVKYGKNIELFKDGEHSRDFIYIKDVVELIMHLFKLKSPGIFNIGTGVKRSFNDIASIMKKELKGIYDVNVDYIEMPEYIRSRYQHNTMADMEIIRRRLQYYSEFFSLENGIKDYIHNYLLDQNYF